MKPVSVANPTKDHDLLIRSLCRNDLGDRLADDFLSRIAEHLFSRPFPSRHKTAEIFSNDRVFG